MRVLHWSESPTEDAFDMSEVLQVLNSGGVIAYPTETLYGLGVDATSAEAVEKINRLKGRSGSPISAMLGSVEWLLDVVQGLGDKAVTLLRQVLPGPLTVICESNLEVTDSIRSTTGAIGFRVPDHAFCLAAANAFGRPITSTSVNPTGAAPARSKTEIETYFGTKLDLLVDAGILPDSPGSTVVDLSREPARILRSGAIPDKQIRKALA